MGKMGEEGKGSGKREREKRENGKMRELRDARPGAIRPARLPGPPISPAPGCQGSQSAPASLPGTAPESVSPSVTNRKAGFSLKMLNLD